MNRAADTNNAIQDAIVMHEGDKDLLITALLEIIARNSGFASRDLENMKITLTNLEAKIDRAIQQNQ